MDSKAGGDSSNTAVRPASEHQFIGELVTQIRAGFRLVPFLGSGCSAHSGILMGQQFSDYLAWTVARCVADRSVPGAFGAKRWDLRRNGWPPAPSHNELTATKIWALAKFSRLVDVCESYIDGSAKQPNESAPRAGRETLPHTLYAPFALPIFRDCPPSIKLPDERVQRHLHRLLTADGLTHGGLLLPGVSPTSEHAIVERAIRSLYDWRSTLRFLSELKLGKDGNTLFLEESEHSVIDSFNVHITRGRRPNLTHTMLAHLRQPAGIRLVLTTNFDTLIEEAFAQQQRRLDVISVSVRGALPDPEVVHARDTLVKLHGTFSETRADFSLDAQPSLEDCKRFFHYVRGGYPDDDQPAFVPGHLLVAGYSGSDARCVQLMKTVLEGDPNALIYWICHSKRQETQLAEIFPEETYGSRIVATTTERVDLLLYEFHQQLCLTLPPGGSSYHINHNVAPSPRLRPNTSEDDGQAPGAAKIVSESDWLTAVSDEAGHERKRRVLVLDGPSGVLDAMRGALAILSAKKQFEKVWIELEDYGSTASLAHDLFQIIAMRRGVLHLSHAELVTDELAKPLEFELEDEQPRGTALAESWTRHVNRLKDHLNIDPTQWVVALYGRNGPGGCAGWREDEFWSEETEYGSDSQVSPFLAFMVGLRDAGFNVLYAPYSEARRRRDTRRREELLEALDLVESPQAIKVDCLREFAIPAAHTAVQLHHNFARFFDVPDAGVGDTPAATLKHELPWKWYDLSPDLKESSASFVPQLRSLLVDEPLEELEARAGRTSRAHQRSRLLYGASLFRQSRHYSSFLSEGVLRCPKRFNLVGSDNDLLRHEVLEQFLNSSDKDLRIFLRKPGGFAWLYRDMRSSLRCLAEFGAAPPRARTVPSAKSWRSQAHFWIGDWYLRAFRVSGHANPLMEAAYHFFQSLKHAHEALPSGGLEDLARVAEHKRTLWRRSLNQLVRTLRSGEAPLSLWFGKGQFQTWFGRPEFVLNAAKLAWEGITACSPRGVEAELSETDGQVLALLKLQLEHLKRLPLHGPPIYTFRSLQGVASRFRTVATKNGPAEALPTLPDERMLDHPRDDFWRGSDRLGCIGQLLDASGPVSDLGDPATPSGARWREAARALRRKYEDDPAGASVAFQELVEWTYVLFSRAKRLEHSIPSLEGEPGAQEQVWIKEGRISPRVRRLLSPPRVRNAWLRVCHFASLVIDGSNSLAPGTDEFVNLGVSKALNMYGVALARLGRFHEAHRRLNHAEAIMSESIQPESLARVGIIDLRRGEACLMEAFLMSDMRNLLKEKIPRHASDDECIDIARARLQELFRAEAADTTDGANDDEIADRVEAVLTWFAPQLAAVTMSAYSGKRQLVEDLDLHLESGLRRIVVARSDDAWGCLERAESLLRGRTHSPLWWSRLRAMQLLILSVTPLPKRPEYSTSTSASDIPHRPLCTRIRSDSEVVLERLWRDGIAAYPSDWYNRLRLLDYYVRAARTRGVADAAEIQTEYNACLKWVEKTRLASGEGGSLSQAHLEKVQSLMRKTIRPKSPGRPHSKTPE